MSTNRVVGEAYAAGAVVTREHDRLLVAVFSIAAGSSTTSEAPNDLAAMLVGMNDDAATILDVERTLGSQIVGLPVYRTGVAVNHAKSPKPHSNSCR